MSGKLKAVSASLIVGENRGAGYRVRFSASFAFSVQKMWKLSGVFGSDRTRGVMYSNLVSSEDVWSFSLSVESESEDDEDEVRWGGGSF